MSAKTVTCLGRQARPKNSAHPKILLADVRQLILQARAGVARTVNSGLVLLYWHMGHRIRRDILREKRAEYGEKILQSLSAKLVQEFGRGYSQRNLASMVRFAEVFPRQDILQSLIAKLGWTHFQAIIEGIVIMVVCNYLNIEKCNFHFPASCLRSPA